MGHSGVFSLWILGKPYSYGTMMDVGYRSQYCWRVIVPCSLNPDKRDYSFFVLTCWNFFQLLVHPGILKHYPDFLPITIHIHDHCRFMLVMFRDVLLRGLSLGEGICHFRSQWFCQCWAPTSVKFGQPASCQLSFEYCRFIIGKLGLQMFYPLFIF